MPTVGRIEDCTPATSLEVEGARRSPVPTPPVSLAAIEARRGVGPASSWETWRARGLHRSSFDDPVEEVDWRNIQATVEDVASGLALRCARHAAQSSPTR
jgi:hypothetical protein